MSAENKPKNQGEEVTTGGESVKIVKNSSKAGGGSYGFTYASLGDMAKQGVVVPKMRTHIERNPITGTIDGEYIEYFDGKEWQIGSRIVKTELRGGGNAAQQYGASLTYARRYTTAMAAAIATDDDTKVEQDVIARRTDQNQPRPAANSQHRIDFDDLRAGAANFTDIDELREWYAGILQRSNPTENMKKAMDRIVSEAAQRIGGANG